MSRLISLVLCLMTVAFMLSACAQDGKDGLNGVNLVPEIEAAMSTRGCLTCHADYKAEVAASGHMTKNAYLPTNPTCLVCHSPNLGYLDIRADDTFTGGVSCTGCHELDPTVKDNPIHSSYALTSDKCITCHGVASGHEKYMSPYATDIAADFGKIEDSFPGHSFASGKAIREGDPRACGVCHSSKVFANIANKVSPRIVEAVTVGGTTTYRTAGGPNEKMYNNFGAYSEAADALNLDREGSDAVGCDGCHQPHSTELLAKDFLGGTNGTTVVASAEFMLCTSCHLANVEIGGTLARTDNTVLSPLYVNPIDAEGNLKDADASLFEHHGLNFTGNPTHSIMDTHFKGSMYSKYSINANGSVKVDNATIINVAGYNIRAGAKNSCTSCHNVHASSIFEPKKDDKSYVALTESWAATKHATQTMTRNDCMPCHAAGREYASMLMGVPATADSNLSVSCMTCHIGEYERADGAAVITGDNAKNLRIAKSAAEFQGLRPSYAQMMSQAQYDAIRAEYPAENVMLCASCHVNRNGSVQTQFKDAVGADNITVAGGHYAEQFGIIFGLGFDLTTNLPAGKAYTVGFRAPHITPTKEVGCMSCHSADDKDHSFGVYSNSVKTTLATKNTACLSCHGNGIVDITGSDYRQQVLNIKTALNSLIPDTAKTFVNLTKYPDSDPANVDVRRKMGMAIGNLRILGGSNVDKGLHAHTTKRFLQELIYDSLLVLQGDTKVEFLNGTINFTNAVKMTGAGNTPLEPANIAILNSFFSVGAANPFTR